MKTLSCFRRIPAAPTWALGLWLVGWGVATGDDIDPVWLGAYTNNAVLDVAVAGRYAYVANGTAGLDVIDISSPASPRRVGGCNAGGGGSARDVAVSGDHAYIAMREWYDGALWRPGCLQVIDISDSTNPRVVSAYTTGGDAMGVAASSNYVYVAVMGWYDGTNSHNAGLQVVDVSIPANPQRIGGCDVPSASGLAVSGDYAYLACPGAGLRVIDIPEPANPRQVGACVYASAGSPFDGGIAVSGHHAYVADAEMPAS